MILRGEVMTATAIAAALGVLLLIDKAGRITSRHAMTTERHNIRGSNDG